MADLPLNVRNDLAGIGLVPAPIKVLSHYPELDDEIAGQVLWFDLATLFAPKPDQRPFIITHDVRVSEPPIKWRRPEFRFGRVVLM